LRVVLTGAPAWVKLEQKLLGVIVDADDHDSLTDEWLMQVVPELQTLEPETLAGLLAQFNRRVVIRPLPWWRRALSGRSSTLTRFRTAGICATRRRRPAWCAARWPWPSRSTAPT
jgi:hypothetical protein